MIRLGHIDYSNCVPVHALLLEAPPAGVELVRGVPSLLNRALAAGEIDAAPCSSIEYARHAPLYRILPLHAIGATGAVQSILLESTVAVEQLDGRTIALPDASATSVVLLRALLELRHGVRPCYAWYEQSVSADPIAAGAAAALRIGDIALARRAPAAHRVYDLGSEWYTWTGLPFAFAVWQVRRELPLDDVTRLARLLGESRAWFAGRADRLADRYAPQYGLTAARLRQYWASLNFDLDAAMQTGLLHFLGLAAQLGEAPAVDRLDIIPLPRE